MGIPGLFRVLSPLLALAGLTLATPAQGLHKEEALGFEFRPPRGWKQIPIRPDESFMVAKYRSDDVERAVDPKTGKQLTHVPEVWVVALLDSKVDGVPEQETRGGTRYKDFQDFLQANYPHGFFVEEESSSDHRGVPVTEFSIRVEADIDVLERRIVARVYDVEVGQIALSYEVIEDAYREHRSDIDRMLKSFNAIPRSGTIQLGVRDSTFLSSSELEEMTPAERKEKKIEAQRAEWENMVAALPEGWDSGEFEGVLVVTHADKKFTRAVAEHVNAVYGWLEDAFPDVGSGEYARRPIVRICDSQEEERAFRDGSGTYWVYGTHLVTHEARRDESWEWEYIGARALEIWFRERDPELYATLPSWLAVGLREVTSSATSKRGKLEFGMGDREKMMRGDLPKADELMDLQELFALTTEELNEFGERDNWKPWFQCVAATRFFVDSGGKRYQVMLADYLKNLRAALDSFEEQDKEAMKDRKRPENEEEEAALRKEIEDLIKRRERELIDQATEATFGEWDRGDWLSLQRAFSRSM